MSVLLDALHRASLDKERVASRSGNAQAPSADPLAKAELQLTAVNSPAAVFPVLQEMGAPHAAPAALGSGVDHGASLEWVPLELSVDSAPPAVPATAPKAPQATSAEPAGVEPPALAMPPQPERPVAIPEAAPPAMPQWVPEPSPAVSAPLAPAVGQSQRRSTAAASAVMSEAQVAREIRQAYQPGATQAVPADRKRIFVLAGVAVLLATTMASFFLGLWGDPEHLLAGSASPGIAMAPAVSPAATSIAQPQPPPTASPTVDPVTAPVLASPAPRAQTPQPVTAASARPEPRPVPVARTPPMARPPGQSLVPADRSPLRVPQVLSPGSAPSAQAVTSRPADRSAVEVGYAALQEGRLDAARAAYERALTTDPQDRDALLGMAYIAQQQGLPEQALSHYQRVLRTDPGNATAQAGLLALEGRGDTTQTAGRARALAQRQPDSAAVHAQAGAAFVRGGLLADAAQSFARAQALEPDNATHIYNHAVALDRLGELPKALVHYEKVVQLLDQSPQDSGTVLRAGASLRAAQLRRALGRNTAHAP
ncbi:MAG: tetratricopeptide repeat protein [Rhodoferax sp.]|nr:tetratricopeptide repeat protein [Rhodoferax sp.]